MIIEMNQDGDGVWLYSDPAQTNLVFQLEAISGRDLTMYDVLLNDTAQWVGNEKARQGLATLRHELTHTYKQYFHDNAMLEMACERYWLAIQTVRMSITGRGLEEKTNRHSAAQSKRRTGETKLKESEKRQVIREYEAAVVKYGTIKELARRFNVSDDTISRTVNVKAIQKKTKQD